MDERRIERLHQRLQFRLHPCAVVRTDNDDFDLVPFNSVRLEAMLRAPEWAAKVVGVFTPRVSLDDLRQAVSA